MIALIIIGAIWASVFVFISLVGFLGAADMDYLGGYVPKVSQSIWFLVMSLPGFIMLFSGIVGKVLSNKFKDTENKLKWTEKRLGEMMQGKSEKKEEQP